jgi:hypothetical protein
MLSERRSEVSGFRSCDLAADGALTAAALIPATAAWFAVAVLAWEVQ